MKKLVYISLIALVILPSLGLAQTGVRIEEVKPDIAPWSEPTWPWPVYRVKVISPNGEEIWNRNEVHTIRWSFPIWSLDEEMGTKENLDQWEKFYWPRASLDLYRRVEVRPTCTVGDICPGEPVEKSVFVKHIAASQNNDGTTEKSHCSFGVNVIS